MNRKWGEKLAVGMILGAVMACPVVAPLSAADEPPAPAPVTVPDEPLSAELVELVAAHNRERAAAKKPPLVANARLVAAARVQARDMAEHKLMSHEGSDGSKFFERIQRQGYVGYGMAENVAMAHKTVPQVMDAWLKSPPHRENILGPYSEIGVARAKSKQGVPFWCVTFGESHPPPIRNEAGVA
jgi:uncharacterized protein YkwD